MPSDRESERGKGASGIVGRGILLTLACIGTGFFRLEPCVNAAKSHIAFKCKKAATETERERDRRRGADRKLEWKRENGRETPKPYCFLVFIYSRAAISLFSLPQWAEEGDYCCKVGWQLASGWRQQHPQGWEGRLAGCRGEAWAPTEHNSRQPAGQHQQDRNKASSKKCTENKQLEFYSCIVVRSSWMPSWAGRVRRMASEERRVSQSVPQFVGRPWNFLYSLTTLNFLLTLHLSCYTALAVAIFVASLNSV